MEIVFNPVARNPDPAFLAALVGKSTFRRQLPNGVCVVPITCLCP